MRIPIYKRVLAALSLMGFVLFSLFVFFIPSGSNHIPKAPEPAPSNVIKPVSSGSPTVPEKTVVSPADKIPNIFTKLRTKYNLVKIPTYDGSYQLTHPKVLYFENGWNGYKYWMSMTPYPFGHDIYENPSIVVSNDGKTWAPPEGLKNPVSGVPSDVALGGHYSDSQIVMRGNTMELWYRYNPALTEKTKKEKSAFQQHSSNSANSQQTQKKIWRRANNSVNIYYRRTSTDGVHWTDAQKLMQGKNGYLSMCVNYEDSKYKIWYATYGGDLFASESKDALHWTDPVLCTVPLPKGMECYHQDIIRYKSKYYLLQTAEKVSNYTFQLYLLQSSDGIHFTQVQQVVPTKDQSLWNDVSFYRSTLFVKDDQFQLFVSLIIPRLKWFVTKVTLPMPVPFPAGIVHN